MHWLGFGDSNTDGDGCGYGNVDSGDGDSGTTNHLLFLIKVCLT